MIYNGPRLAGLTTLSLAAVLAAVLWLGSGSAEIAAVAPDTNPGAVEDTAVALAPVFTLPEPAQFHSLADSEIPLVCMFVGGWLIYPAAALLTLGTVVVFCQFVFYKTTFDPFFRKKNGYNVVGVIEPSDEPRQQIIISGHHDSPYEITFLNPPWQKLYPIRIALGVFFYLVTNAACIVWAIDALADGHVHEFVQLSRYAALVGTVFVVWLYFFLGKTGTPGAGDNMIASAIVVQLARVFGRGREAGHPALKHTRLIAASFDAEECGLRGSRAYARRQRHQLQAIPTTVFNMDSIYEKDQIKFLSSDINGGLKLSAEMASECQRVATELG